MARDKAPRWLLWATLTHPHALRDALQHANRLYKSQWSRLEGLSCSLA
jgi:hypothetical protein